MRIDFDGVRWEWGALIVGAYLAGWKDDTGKRSMTHVIINPLPCVQFLFTVWRGC